MIFIVRTETVVSYHNIIDSRGECVCVCVCVVSGGGGRDGG